MAAKTDKGRTMVTIHRDTLKQKIDTFIQENQIMQISKDLTESFLKTNSTNHTQIQRNNRQKTTKILTTNETHGTKT